MFASLRVRNYRLYATGQLVSLTGTWMQRVAQDWLVLQLTNSGTALGLVTALQFAPSLIFGLWGGVLADRYNKRAMLFLTQSGMGLAALCLGLLDVAGVVQYWHVLALAAILGVISAVDIPVRQSFVMEMVGDDLVANAVAINATTFNTARVLGPAVAGALIAVIGTGPAFLMNAASSVGVLLALVLMRLGELHPSPQVARARGQLRAGVQYVRGRADLITTMVLIFIVGTFGMNFSITTALLAKQLFNRGAEGYGVLSTMIAVGSCLGAIVATRRRERPSQLFLVGSVIAFSLVEIVCGVMPNFALTAVLLVPAGFVMLTLTTASNASVQLGVESTMRGRVMALYMVCFMGGKPAGAPLIGWVAGAAGPRWGMIGPGLVCLVAAVCVGLVIGRRLGLAPSYVADRVTSVSFLPTRPNIPD
jgi:MFS family permease